MGTKVKYKKGDRVRVLEDFQSVCKGAILTLRHPWHYNSHEPDAWTFEDSACWLPIHAFEPVAGDAEPLTAFNTQVGGGHYKDMAIQPLEYIMKNGIGFPEGNIIKYVSRWRKKNGVEDLKKARHMLDFVIEQVEAGTYS